MLTDPEWQKEVQQLPTHNTVMDYNVSRRETFGHRDVTAAS